MAMATAVFLYVLYRWVCAEEWLTEAGYHVSEANLPYHDLVVPLVPSAFLLWFGVLLLGGLAAVIVGWQLRWTTWLAWACLLYVTLADQLSSFVTNKLAVVALLVVALAPHNKVPHSVWPVRVLQITLIVSYFTAGWNKAVWGEWLKDPYVLWSQLQGTYRTDLAAWMIRTLPLGVWPVLQYAALAFELLAPLHLGIKSLRVVGLLWGLSFQLLIAATMHQLIYFSLVMLSFYVLFVDEKLLHRIYNLFTKGRGARIHVTP